MTQADDLWQRPPADHTLHADEVHIWRVALDQPDEMIAALRRLLWPDEVARADRFVFEHLRRDFVVARGVLRLLVGRYLGVGPHTIQFHYGPRGKPAVAGRGAGGQLGFNLSHSHRLALCAFAWNREVGVDVEYKRPLPDAEQIVDHFFSPRECAIFRALPAEHKHDAFFTCWARKEAFIKACGDGLSRPLDQFDVTFRPGEPEQLSVVGDTQESARWSLRALSPGAEYAGAVVVDGHGWQLACWQWQGQGI